MSQNTWGWSNGGNAPTHMNSRAPISITGTPRSLWKWGTMLSVMISTAWPQGAGFAPHHSGPAARFLACHGCVVVKKPQMAGNAAGHCKGYIRAMIHALGRKRFIAALRHPAFAILGAIFFAAAAFALIRGGVDARAALVGEDDPVKI